MTLYAKYRPHCFDELVGNTALIRSLRGLLSNGDPPHAYLFQGPTGCGKTTLGRIIASELGVSERDYEEIDTADMRGIDTARRIRHNMHYKALSGQRRVWLIDECHRLTGEAQDALLKGLEDPPPHGFFVLCTTRPDRLTDTIRGRCVIHTVQPLKIREMMGLLGRIASREGKPLGRKVLQAIAEKSNVQMKEGGDGECYPRFALQLLEKVLVASAEEQAEVIKESEGVIGNADFLATALLNHQGWKAVAQILERIQEDDIEQTRRRVLGYCRKVLLNTESERAAEIIDKLSSPFFDSGAAGLALACYAVATKWP